MFDLANRPSYTSRSSWSRLRFMVSAILFAFLVLSQVELVHADVEAAVSNAGPAATTSLADAIEAKNFALATECLRDSAEVNATQPDGMTALHWAVHHDETRWSARLIEAGADVSAKNRYGITPLYLACLNGNDDIVNALLRSGADANASFDGGETVLMVAARTGRVGAVQALIENGADVDAKQRKGQNSLMWAAAEGNLAVVETLLKAGADYRSELASGFTPLFFAVRQGHTEVALRLLRTGLDVNAPMQPKRSSGKGPKKGTTPLMLAVINGHFETANALLDVGANPNDSGAGYTALHALTWVRKPIRGDGDPPPMGSGSVTSIEFARQLIQRGAKVDALHGKHSPPKLRLNRTDATPLLLASETGDIELIRLLLEHGADPHRPNVDGCTPLLAACGVGVISNGDETAGTEEEAIETVELLLSLDADINAVDQFGHSAMHGAAYKSWTKMIPFLVKNGADIKSWNRENVRGWTPLRIAQGYRPGNFRPSAETIQAIQAAQRSSEDSTR